MEVTSLTWTTSFLRLQVLQLNTTHWELNMNQRVSVLQIMSTVNVVKWEFWSSAGLQIWGPEVPHDTFWDQVTFDMSEREGALEGHGCGACSVRPKHCSNIMQICVRVKTCGWKSLSSFEVYAFCEIFGCLYHSENRLGNYSNLSPFDVCL